MMKNKFWSMMMFLVMLLVIVACGSDNENEDTVSVSLTETNLTEDGYFDGMLYYKIISNSPLEVAVNKADKSVVNVEIPSTVSINGKKYKCTSIFKDAFKKCHGLISISIPNSVTIIGDEAFYDCINLDKVIIKDIAAWCNINFEDSPMRYAHHIYLNESEIKELVIPNVVTRIGNYAFCSCIDITSITIPNSVTNIGNHAFSGCSGLTSIIIPNSVTSVGEGAFSWCSSLKSISISSSLMSIGGYTFRNCSNLTSITIPNSVTTIGGSAFESCLAMSSIHCQASTPPSCSPYRSFGNIYSTATLYVPKGSLEAYKTANEWSRFLNIVEE